jgi:predicted Fe-S protein YdhL (DUF1289 family)
MWAFVMARMKAMQRPTTWWSGSRACFGCFRVRPERHFSPEQYALSYLTRGREYRRRRCWECLRRFYHPRQADAKARERFHRQEMCGVCKCMRYRDEDCRGCVVLKDEIAEWARRKREKMSNRGKSFDIWQETGNFIPSQWFSEDSGAVNEGSESDTDDVWDEGIGPCLKILGLEDEAFPSEHIVSDPQSCSSDLDFGVWGTIQCRSRSRPLPYLSSSLDDRGEKNVMRLAVPPQAVETCARSRTTRALASSNGRMPSNASSPILVE